MHYTDIFECEYKINTWIGLKLADRFAKIVASALNFI